MRAIVCDGKDDNENFLLNSVDLEPIRNSTSWEAQGRLPVEVRCNLLGPR